MPPLKKLTPPIDFVKIRIALVNAIKQVTGLDVIFMEAEAPDSPRPKKPYIGFKITTPSARMGGDDDHRAVPDNMGNPTTKQTAGGQRKMTISFQCYGNSHEEAYNYLTLWEGALDMYTVQEQLRRSGIAVWIIGSVADLSLLLNTGYEGRAQMDCTFGIASNLTEDLSEIVTAPVQETIQTDSGTVTDNVTIST